MSTPGDLTSLGDPTRARILRLIRESDEGRARVGRLAEVLGLRQPTVSHHMKALHEDGIVVRKPEGRRVWYSIAGELAQNPRGDLGAPGVLHAHEEYGRTCARHPVSALHRLEACGRERRGPTRDHRRERPARQ